MLPIINVFSRSYEFWMQRQLSQQEILEHYKNMGYFIHTVNDKLETVISNHLDAAKYLAIKGAENGLGRFVNEQLDSDAHYKYWRQCMPSNTSSSLASFQQKYPAYNQLNVDFEINKIGRTLTSGQFLFHGGLWGASENQIVLNKPFSTSFCPQVALRNSEWNGKAHDAGQIDLFVLRAKSPKTNVFAYRRKGTRMGNENEVLFASGAILTLTNRTLMRNDYLVAKYNYPDKKIPIYVIEVDIS